MILTLNSNEKTIDILSVQEFMYKGVPIIDIFVKSDVDLSIVEISEIFTPDTLAAGFTINYGDNRIDNYNNYECVISISKRTTDFEKNFTIRLSVKGADNLGVGIR